MHSIPGGGLQHLAFASPLHSCFHLSMRAKHASKATKKQSLQQGMHSRALACNCTRPTASCSKSVKYSRTKHMPSALQTDWTETVYITSRWDEWDEVARMQDKASQPLMLACDIIDWLHHMTRNTDKRISALWACDCWSGASNCAKAFTGFPKHLACASPLQPCFHLNMRARHKLKVVNPTQHG